jgi:hypothetical protein
MTTAVLAAMLVVPGAPLPREVASRTAPVVVSAAMKDGNLVILIPTQVVKQVPVSRIIGGEARTGYQSVEETVYRQRLVTLNRVRAYDAKTGEMAPEKMRDLFKATQQAAIVSDQDRTPWREWFNRDAGPTIVLVVQGWKVD